ncbi:MAG: ribonuclease III domain-containing protein, partial [Candidatus Pacearchaeota archaeon]|nr:ribonuclease III domain-containing protein [Candidatus Pacearchaeota archaeon]
MSKDILSLEKKFGIEFRDKDLLQQAFVHRSYLNENPEFKLSNNERLEFLGDAVLELVTTRELFLKYPDKTEGELT